MSLPSRIDESLKSPQLSDLGADTLDAILDVTIESEALQSIPIINILYGVHKLRMTWSDRIFTNKLLSFFRTFRDIDPKIRKRMVDDINADPKIRLRTGEKLMYVIDKAEDKNSAMIIGLLFRRFLTSKSDYQEFIEASAAVNSLPFHLLDWVYKNDVKQVDLEISGQLVASGFFVLDELSYELKIQEQEDEWAGTYHENYIEVGNKTASLSYLGRLVVQTMEDAKF